MGHCERAALICFQCDLLSKHDIARHQRSCWHEAPASIWSAVFADFLHVGRNPKMDAILFAGCRARYVEILQGVELVALLGR